METSTPKVSVLTTAYNGERFLARAIESILRQTLREFEYVLVDDASTDGTADMVARYAAQDRRIVTLRTPSNVGAAAARNLGLAHARGEYLAILDSDDVAAGDRLERQMTFLDEHPEVGLVGSQVQEIGENEEELRFIVYPTSSMVTRWSLFLGTPALNSAAMMRRALVVELGGYSAEHTIIDDYELFCRVSRVSQVANLPECLAYYRRGPWQVSSVQAKRQGWQAVMLAQSMIGERLGLRPALPEVAALFWAVRGVVAADEGMLHRAIDLLQSMYSRFVEQEHPTEPELGLVGIDCARRFLAVAWSNRKEFRLASRVALSRATLLDPQVLERPRNRGLLRWLDWWHTQGHGFELRLGAPGASVQGSEPG